MENTLATSFIFMNTYILVSTIDSTGDSAQVLELMMTSFPIILFKIILKKTTAAAKATVTGVSAIIMMNKLISKDRLNYLKIISLAVSFSNLRMQASVT